MNSLIIIYSVQKFARFTLTSIIVMIVVLTATTSGCSVNKSPGFALIEVLSARAQIDDAVTLATRWESTAELKRIKADIIGPHQSQRPSLIFRFESPAKSRSIYIVACVQQGCEGSVLNVSMTSLWAPLDMSEVKIDSDQAVKIALEVGGQRFLTSHDATMWVELSHYDPRDNESPIIWLVAFAAYSDNLSVVVDAKTGQVIESY
jgi:hypothetical protein